MLAQSLVTFSLFIATALGGPVGNTAFAAEPPPDANPLTVTDVRISPENPKPGDVAEVKIGLKLDPGYHAYLDQYRLELVGPSNFHLSEIQVQPTTKFTDPISKKVKIGTEGFAEMVSLLEIPNDIRGRSVQIEMELTYQACGDGFCLFPKKIPIVKTLTFQGQSENSIAKALEKGWVSALLIVFFAGVLTSLTPCIFPMIPITLAVLGTKDLGRSKLRGFSISLSYVMGIALTYSLLGVAAAKTGAMFGAALGHPIVVGLIATIFVVMGLSMLGLYEIALPASVTNRLGKTKLEKGLAGAFVSGLIAGVVASPCVGPVLVSILAYVANTQNTFTGFVLLFTFALGLGQLFLILGTFHQMLQMIPRSGAWMEKVKFLFGTVMIGMALYFVYPVAHSALFDGLVASTLIFLAIFFGAFRVHPGAPSRREKVRKGLALLGFVLGCLFFVKALVPKHLTDRLFPSAQSAESKVNVARPDWFQYSDELLAKAIAEKRPVILDFKAEWCLACKELELYTFSDPRVLATGKNFLWLYFDATKPSPELEALQKKYEIGGLPFVAIYDSHGTFRTDLTLHGFEDADAFLKRLGEALR